MTQELTFRETKIYLVQLSVWDHASEGRSVWGGVQSERAGPRGLGCVHGG